MNKDLHLKKATEIAELVNSKKITATEVTKYFLSRAEKLNTKINAFNFLTPELAIEQAQNIDKQIQDGKTFILAGVPIGIKDNLNVKGIKTTCSSQILKNYVSPYESTVTSKLWEAGAICIGKTNLDEFAMGSSTEHSAFAPTKNPWDLQTVPGGSSGGSAAAVASRMVPIALGSDTGGSIRQPAALCGIVGMKPTYGLVSRYGLVAFASSLDQVGPLATNVEDASLLLSVISGHDEKDSTSLEAKYEHISAQADLKGLKIGLIREFASNGKGINQEISNSINSSLQLFKELGAEVKEVSMPLISEHCLDVYYVIAPSEASSNLARYDGVRFGYRDTEATGLLSMYKKTRATGFGSEVVRRIMIGTYALSSGYYDAYYKKAQQVRKLISDEFEKTFKEVDVLLTPTSPLTAFPFGDKLNDPLSMYLCDIATIPANLAGLPAISVNCGFDSSNLPIGLQLMSGQQKDQKLLQIAKAFEEALRKNNSQVSAKLPELIGKVN
ncbi:MAG: Asp-tRNA(Asn)/Glu-tRNA(Gln) amidotransferase subunit GatA [Candidatus Caenarcaniphilales bacterium]|nr:Asp-tRNA(Asn)/Glu-tRNA(Gln) amidotransferase subunit GatA [Candidatus Caenarcaniphilales bacterium]